MAPIKMITGIPQDTTKTFGWIHIHCHGTNNRLQLTTESTVKLFLKIFLTVPNGVIFSQSTFNIKTLGFCNSFINFSAAKKKSYNNMDYESK